MSLLCLDDVFNFLYFSCVLVLQRRAELSGIFSPLAASEALVLLPRKVTLFFRTMQIQHVICYILYRFLLYFVPNHFLPVCMFYMPLYAVNNQPMSLCAIKSG